MRKDIDIWTSTHIGLKIKGFAVIDLILRGLENEKNFNEISELIKFSFKDIDVNKIKKDTKIIYKKLKEILI